MPPHHHPENAKTQNAQKNDRRTHALMHIEPTS